MNAVINFFKPFDKRLGSLSSVGGSEFDTRPISGEIRRLDLIASSLGHNHIDVLKMDIEGAEYEVIQSLLEMSGLRIDQILIEFHHRFSGITKVQTRKAVKQIKSLGFKLVSVSPSGEEYGFANSAFLDSTA